MCVCDEGIVNSTNLAFRRVDSGSARRIVHTGDFIYGMGAGFRWFLVGG